MNLVVDTSVLIAVIANEPEKVALLEHTQGITLVAPASVHWEVGHAFSAMLRRGRISREQAGKALTIYLDIPVRFIDVGLEDALILADQLGIYAYDAYIIAAAQMQRCALVSLDRGLIHAAKQAGIKVLEVRA